MIRRKITRNQLREAFIRGYRKGLMESGSQNLVSELAEVMLNVLEKNYQKWQGEYSLSWHPRTIANGLTKWIGGTPSGAKQYQSFLSSLPKGTFDIDANSNVDTIKLAAKQAATSFFEEIDISSEAQWRQKDEKIFVDTVAKNIANDFEEMVDRL